MKLPKISIILPVFNEFKRGNVAFQECLESVFSQDYPKDKYEVLLIDGGSTDDTLKTARKFDIKYIKNPHTVEEKAKPLGVKKAKGEIICFIDSDNILHDKQFLRKMIKPFSDKNISATQTLYFDYRKSDPLVTKYVALMSGDDPMAIYMGLNDRLCFMNNKWTGFPHKEEKKEGYLKVKIFRGKVPIMGSNGFFVRKNIIDKIDIDPFVHSDFAYRMVEKGYDTFGLVDVGLVHYMHGVSNFFKKKLRRMKRRFGGELKQEYNYGVSLWKAAFTALYILILFPVLFDTVRGFIRKPSAAWLFHPIASYGVVLLYIYHFLFRKS